MKMGERLHGAVGDNSDHLHTAPPCSIYVNNMYTTLITIDTPALGFL